MWSRIELKERGKFNFKRAYWASVIVALLFSILSGSYSSNQNNSHNNEYSYQILYQTPVNIDIDSDNVIAKQVIRAVNQKIPIDIVHNFITSSLGTFIIIAIAVVGILFYFFISIPISVGKNRYFMELSNGNEGKVGSILYPYRNNRMFSVIETMFIMNIKLILWYILLVIPGIIKTYEYRMIPYILSENPDLPRGRVFELSKEMMRGNKFDSFVLDLSFIGWMILSALLFFIPHIFYVGPYIYATEAELYSTLRQHALDRNLADYSELPGFNEDNKQGLPDFF